MTRSRSTSRVGSLSLFQPAGCPRKGSRPLLLLLLLGLLSGSPAAWAQPPAGTRVPRAAADSVATVPAAPAVQSTSHWPTVLAVLGGVAIGALGAWLWAGRLKKAESTARPLAEAPPEIAAEPAPKPTAQNVRVAPPAAPPTSTPAAPPPATPAADAAPAPAVEVTPGRNASAKSMREMQGKAKASGNPATQNKKNQANFNSSSSFAARNEQQSLSPGPARSVAMNPTNLPDDNQPLEPGQTIEWAAPTSTPPAIQEMIAASEPMADDAAAPAVAAVGNGPTHYYAPAPDVPSIEHRKLSPNPLPQMPLLITLPQAEATTAQFSFSPQADQSRIIGNGVRELKEFFQFELPPTEQFTTIKNLKPGRLEKRDDAWHVVQKAEIALS